MPSSTAISVAQPVSTLVIDASRKEWSTSPTVETEPSGVTTAAATLSTGQRSVSRSASTR